MIINIIALGTAALYAITVIIGLIKLRYDNKLLKSKLRRALTDCRTFYEIESRLCDACASCYALGSDSAAATKVNARRSVYEDGFPYLSTGAVPSKIEQELEKL